MWRSPLRGWRRSTPCPPCRYGAPIVLVVVYDKNSVFVFPGGKANSGEEDASIVATHMMLAKTVKYL